MQAYIKIIVCIIQDDTDIIISILLIDPYREI